ncbi:MAG TPA: hypothetical protein PKB15_08550 [Acidimicrobiia bacterium]|nr:hypothetical protein [Acidimicrobiia bacterium]
MGVPSITIYVDMKGTPHAFFEFKDAGGSVEYYGFASSRAGRPYTTKGKVGRGLELHSKPDLFNETAGYMEDVAWKKEIPLTQPLPPREGAWKAQPI